MIIRHSWEEDKLPVLAAIIKSFQSYHPDVMFDVLYVPPELLLERFIADSSEGLAPDLLLGPADWGPELFQQDLLADLNADISSSLLNSLNPAALESARVDPALIGLPYSISGVVLYRNKDVITIQADNFNELVTLAQTSTQGATIGSYLERSFFYSGGHLIGLGGEFIDLNGLPAFNNGQGIAWLELLKAFDQAGPTNFFGDADLDRFKLGEIGWIIDGSWNLPQLSEGYRGRETCGRSLADLPGRLDVGFCAGREYLPELEIRRSGPPLCSRVYPLFDHARSAIAAGGFRHDPFRHGF